MFSPSSSHSIIFDLLLNCSSYIPIPAVVFNTRLCLFPSFPGSIFVLQIRRFDPMSSLSSTLGFNCIEPSYNCTFLIIVGRHQPVLPVIVAVLGEDLDQNFVRFEVVPSPRYSPSSRNIDLLRPACKPAGRSLSDPP